MPPPTKPDVERSHPGHGAGGLRGAGVNPSDPRLRAPLALHGGPPAVPKGPPAWPPQDREVHEALLRAFEDSSWGKYIGGNVARLEAALAEFHGTQYASTCGSGTYAIELALRAVDVGPDDEVVLAAYEFPGSFLCVEAVGAIPVLVDVDPLNCNLCPARLSEAVGDRTKAIIVSHLHGGVVPMSEVKAIADARGVPVIEDAAQCPGSRVEGRRAGSWGDVGVLSFGGSKLLSAGRGGALVTNNQRFYDKIINFQMRANVLCPISELQAAVILPQLGRLDERNSIRLKNAERLGALISGIPGIAPFRNQVADALPGYYKLGFFYDPHRCGLPRGEFVRAMRAEGVAVNEGFGPPWRPDGGRDVRTSGDIMTSMNAYNDVVVLHHPVLLGTACDVEEVALAFFKVLSHFSKR